MSYVYHQRTGRFELQGGSGGDRLIAFGYAGHADGVNVPEKEHERGIGPIPAGTYVLQRRHNHPRFKDPCWYLDPIGATIEKLEELGRGQFFIHGDNAKRNQSASTGCIVLSLLARMDIERSGGRTLVVVP
jgi:hypothetical protein